MEPESQSKDKPFLKPAGKWIVGLGGVASVVLAVAAFYQSYQFRAPQTSATPASAISAEEPQAVSALGRLEPQGEVIKLSAPTSLEGARIKEILVEQGAIVRSEQKIAILDNIDARTAALQQAEKQVNVAKARLAQVEAGAKAGEISAQKATVARLEAQLAGEIATQKATIARLNAQLQGDTTAQTATVDRWKAQVQGDKRAQEATIARLKAQLQGEIAAQEATIQRLKAQLQGEKTAKEATMARLEAELNNARSEFSRYQALYREGVIAASQIDTKRLTLETVQKQLVEEQANLTKIEQTLKEQIVEEQANLNKIITTSSEQLSELQANLKKIEQTGKEQIAEANANRNKTVGTLAEQLNEAEATRTQTIATLQQQIAEAKANLERISEVRPVDVEAAKAEVESAIATKEKAQADLDQSYVKAPVEGQILKINARPGEVVQADKGIAELGQTNQMFVVAEVYESDISKVRLGQKATITNNAFIGNLKGTVAEIGLQIGKKDILNTDPAADVDSRVVEVKIRLDKEDSRRVAGLTNLQVEVTINLSQEAVSDNSEKVSIPINKK